MTTGFGPCSMLSYFTDHASSPRLPFPPLFSLTILNKKNTAGTSQKKVFRMKTSACRDGTLKNTTTHSHHPYILCHFANYAHQKTLYMHLAYSHPLNEYGTQHCSVHSFPHKRKSISAMFSTDKISQHNSTYHTDPALLTVSAYKTDYTCHAQ